MQNVVYLYQLINQTIQPFRNTVNRQNMTHYITGRKCETFTKLEEAKNYADKWRDKSISVYKDGKYFATIHKKGDKWS